MQFERLLSLNHGVVAWFAHLHDLGFQPTLKNPGNVCGGNTVSIQPYDNPLYSRGAQTPNMYDMDMRCSLKGKVLQPQR